MVVVDVAAMAAADTALQANVPKAQAATNQVVALANAPRKVAVLAAAMEAVTAAALVATGVAMTAVASAATVTAVAMVAASAATTVVDTTPPRVPPQADSLTRCVPAWT